MARLWYAHLWYNNLDVIREKGVSLVTHHTNLRVHPFEWYAWYGHGTPTAHLWQCYCTLKSGLSYRKHAIHELTLTHENSNCCPPNIPNVLRLI